MFPKNLNCERRMNNNEESETSADEKHKQVLQLVTSNICKDVEKSSGVIFDKEMVNLIAEIAIRKSELFIHDLDSFAKHAKRKRIAAEDVVLLARRNHALVESLNALKPNNSKKVT